MGVSCSNESKATPTKADVTLDPNSSRSNMLIFSRYPGGDSREELPSHERKWQRLPRRISHTIHVTSLGSERVVELRMRLGITQESQSLLTLQH